MRVWRGIKRVRRSDKIPSEAKKAIPLITKLAFKGAEHNPNNPDTAIVITAEGIKTAINHNGSILSNGLLCAKCSTCVPAHHSEILALSNEERAPKIEVQGARPTRLASPGRLSSADGITSPRISARVTKSRNFPINVSVFPSGKIKRPSELREASANLRPVSL